MKTRTFTKRQAGLLTLSALAVGLIAATQEAAAAGNIANTKHNLSSVRSGTSWGSTQFSSGTGDIYAQTGSDQICVFCHTPHGAVSPATTAPLWNREVSAASAYSAYVMSGSNSTGTASVGGMALACLSCHDGTQAMDAMLNGPGFGNAPGGGGVRVGVTDGGANYTWSNTEGPTMSGNGAPLLGTDLTNDHPIGMLYCGGGATNEPGVKNTTCSDADFMGATSVTGVNKSYVQGSTAAGDLPLKLYGPDLANSTVLCGTCHDPHLDNGRTFLRQPAAGSKICLTCHTK